MVFFPTDDTHYMIEPAGLEVIYMYKKQLLTKKWII